MSARSQPNSDSSGFIKLATVVIMPKPAIMATVAATTTDQRRTFGLFVHVIELSVPSAYDRACRLVRRVCSPAKVVRRPSRCAPRRKPLRQNRGGSGLWVRGGMWPAPRMWVGKPRHGPRHALPRQGRGAGTAVCRDHQRRREELAQGGGAQPLRRDRVEVARDFGGPHGEALLPRRRHGGPGARTVPVVDETTDGHGRLPKGHVAPDRLREIENVTQGEVAPRRRGAGEDRTRPAPRGKDCAPGAVP